MTITKVTDAGLDKSRIVTPLIINGDMSVAQRGTSVSSVTSDGYRTCDRWRLQISTAGTWTVSQSTDVPTGQGFGKSFKLDCTTADTSLDASHGIRLETRLEGQNLQMLKKGTSNAESTTLSFWVKSNKTGTYPVTLRDVDNSRLISKTYTISSADTWEKKTLIYDGDTTGSLNNDNGESFRFEFWLGAGTNFTSGTAQTTWGASADNLRASGLTVNLADSTSNEWYITGVQFEIGTFGNNTIPDFPFESFTSNLTKCSRYYTEINQNGANGWRTFSGRINGSADVENIGITLPTFLRTGNPTVTKSGSCVAQVWDENGYHATSGGGGTFSILTDSGDNTPFLNCKQTGFSGLHNEGAGNVSFVIGDPSIAIDAEL